MIDIDYTSAQIEAVAPCDGPGFETKSGPNYDAQGALSYHRGTIGNVTVTVTASGTRIQGSPAVLVHGSSLASWKQEDLHEFVKQIARGLGSVDI
ncbi:MAG: hypothetical protein AAFU38_12615 [Bacteroidota bacterium]